MPFPMVQYKSDARKGVYTIMDRVDTIKGPAMVVPVSCNYSDYVETNRDMRVNAEFYSIPFEFLCRDDWADIHHQGRVAAADTGIDSHSFEEAPKEVKKNMLREIRGYTYGDVAFEDAEEEEASGSDMDTSSDEDEASAENMLHSYKLRKRR